MQVAAYHRQGNASCISTGTHADCHVVKGGEAGGGEGKGGGDGGGSGGQKLTKCVMSPVYADFATVADVDLGSLPVVLVLTGELDVLELVQHFRHTCGGLGQHGLHRHPHHKCHMLLQLLCNINKTCQGRTRCGVKPFTLKE